MHTAGFASKKKKKNTKKNPPKSQQKFIELTFITKFPKKSAKIEEFQAR